MTADEIVSFLQFCIVEKASFQAAKSTPGLLPLKNNNKNNNDKNSLYF